MKKIFLFLLILIYVDGFSQSTKMLSSTNDSLSLKIGAGIFDAVRPVLTSHDSLKHMNYANVVRLIGPGISYTNSGGLTFGTNTIGLGDVSINHSVYLGNGSGSKKTFSYVNLDSFNVDGLHNFFLRNLAVQNATIDSFNFWNATQYVCGFTYNNSTGIFSQNLNSTLIPVWQSSGAEMMRGTTARQLLIGGSASASPLAKLQVFGGSYFGDTIRAPSAAIPTGSTSDSVIVETTTSGIMVLKKVAQSSIGGAVSSVSNANGTLTISPITGAVVASLALGHANTWTGVQTQPAPIFTGLTGSGANDSIVTVDPTTGQTHRRSGTINLTFANGIKPAATADSVLRGGALNQNTSTTGGGFSLSEGTFASHISTYNIYADTINLNGGVQFSGGNPTDANLTVANEGMLYLLSNITANRTITLPAAVGNPGRILVFPVFNVNAFNWSFSTTVKNTDNSTVTTLNNGYTYILESHGTYGWIVISRTASNSSGVNNYQHTIFTPTTGGTVTLINNQYNIINPAGALVALTVNLPSGPVNNDVVYIKFTQTISTVTYANGTVADGITAPTAGGLTILVYDASSSTWY